MRATRIVVLACAAAEFCVDARADVASAVAQLKTDVDARVAAIGTSSTRESTNLLKASRLLAQSAGATTAAQGPLLVAAGKALAASTTTDAAVVADVVAVIDAQCDSAKAERTAAAAAQAQLLLSRHATTVDDLLAAADGVLSAAKADLPGQFSQAESLVVKAYGKFLAAFTKAQSLRKSENGAPTPTGVAIFSTAAGLYLTNSGTRSYVVKSVRVFGELTRDGAPPTDFTGENAKTLVPGLFSGLHEGILDPVFVDSAGGKHPAVLEFTSPLLLKLVPAGSTNVELKGRLWITFKGRRYFSVAFDLKRP